MHMINNNFIQHWMIITKQAKWIIQHYNNYNQIKFLSVTVSMYFKYFYTNTFLTTGNVR